MGAPENGSSRGNEALINSRKAGFQKDLSLVTEGNISLEYEYHWENSVPEVAQCIGFVRGYGAGRYVTVIASRGRSVVI